MNPSRDIEKLFDKFGGDAGNYQEIGRENEAVHARTRWPLLATLDLSQPSIPSIVPRREAHLPHTQDRSGEHRTVPNSLTQPEGAAPINRGKPPLFARAHRKTVPPVANVTLPAAPVGAERFSALVEAVEGTSNAGEAEAVAAAAAQPQQPARLPQPLFRPFHTQQEQHLPQLAQQQPQPRTQPLATPASAPGQPTGFAAALQRSNTATRSPSLPRVQAPQVAQAAAQAPAPTPEAKSQSILGKLFRAQPHAQPAHQPSAPPDSLESMFQRLRGPAASAPATTPAPVNSPLNAPVTGAGSWLAKRHSSS
ncbi:cellulose biosynthesis protein BcsP [Caballeronia sordidicola]|uniref:cellulose biosynthesis protein BcsP n=1 Tax=Caballeronia sordidicola TaxID=196367 RepID=UPI00054F007B|nr:cellulose biosynthesis protein BcsP [Caballeronia sordidicola]